MRNLATIALFAALTASASAAGNGDTSIREYADGERPCLFNEDCIDSRYPDCRKNVCCSFDFELTSPMQHDFVPTPANTPSAPANSPIGLATTPYYTPSTRLEETLGESSRHDTEGPIAEASLKHYHLAATGAFHPRPDVILAQPKLHRKHPEGATADAKQGDEGNRRKASAKKSRSEPESD